MKHVITFFALLSVAMGQFVKVPRQDASVEVQNGAMSTKDGGVVPFENQAA
ncbi:hypothetical protein GGS20DRAFT_584791 [Poronia punctata]|nr:hypothetical protein GGS20DRAFT_584791 [Poronia punctata]